MPKIDKLLVIIILILLISIFCSDSTFASYKNVYESEGSIEIAKPIFNLVTSDVTDKINPINDLEISFSVTNFTNLETSDVSLKYYLTILFENSKLPLEYKLYRKVNDALVDVSFENDKSESFVLDKDVKESQYFILSLSWNKSKTSYEYQNITDYVNINAYVEQL